MFRITRKLKKGGKGGGKEHGNKPGEGMEHTLDPKS